MSDRNTNPNKGSDSTSTQTTNTSDRNGNSSGEGGTGTTKDRISLEKDSNSPLVVVDIEVTETEVVKKRGRPKGSTNASNNSSKNSSKKNQETALNSSDISAMIQGMFGLVSLRVGSHWNISKDEANSISVPFCNILERYSLSSKVSEMSDGILLIMAVGTIMLPRILLTKTTKETKKINDLTNQGVIKNVKESGSPTKSRGADVSVDGGTIEPHDSSNGKTYYHEPTIAY